MEPQEPSTDGSYLGQTGLNDGVVWTWTGTEWTRGKRPGVLRRKRRGIRVADPGPSDDRG